MNEIILVVDDEPKIVRLARDYLERDGFQVIGAGDGRAALTIARREHPDLIVLDLMLPLVNGWEVCRTLRSESEVPIIMLTARSEESDQVLGLELGADDYVTKPFSPRALVARVRALLRRTQKGVVLPQIIRIGDLKIDMEAHQICKGEQPVHLTPNEFRLLVVLAQHSGQLLSREQLVENLHGVTAVGFDRSIDSHIKNLRRKLEDDPSNPRYILTVYGMGYKFVEQ